MKNLSDKSIILSSYSFFLALAAVFAAVAVIFSSPALRMTEEEAARLADSGAVKSKPTLTVIIDAGHGGEDGGAVAADGTCEKDINLEIARRLYLILTSYGIDCRMTRDDDIMLSDGEGGTKKMRDLKRRIAATEGGGCIFLSIHQNKFPDESCRGTQIYYSKNAPESQKLASDLQNAVKTYLQPDNKRQIKPAGSEIFVLDRCTVPAVLAECGFLSNPGELSLLKTEDYQKKLCCVIAFSVAGFLLDGTAPGPS